MTRFELTEADDKMVDILLRRCLREAMSDNCKEFNKEESCNKVKRYMAACPDAKPKRMYSMGSEGTESKKPDPKKTTSAGKIDKTTKATATDKPDNENTDQPDNNPDGELTEDGDQEGDNTGPKKGKDTKKN